MTIQAKGNPLRGTFLVREPWLVAVVASLVLRSMHPSEAWSADDPGTRHWIGTWAAAPQHSVPSGPQAFRSQTLRLIVHTSAGGNTIRIRLSNTFGDQPLTIGRARIARRTAGANIDVASDRPLTFGTHSSTTIPAGAMTVSDPVDLLVPPLSDLAVSLFLPNRTVATTVHILAQQTNYVSTETGDSTAAVSFPVERTISFWPFLTGVEVTASPRSRAIVAFGSSLTDGDGSTTDANRRWPDVLSERLAKSSEAQFGVLNEGIIGNRLLSDSKSPRQSGGPPPLGPVFAELGIALGQSGLERFDRDVVSQSGVTYVIIALGVNDILFPGAFVPATESVTAHDLIAGYLRLVSRAHEHGIRAIGTTIPPFEHAAFRDPDFDGFFTPEKEMVRDEVNTWIRNGGECDGVIDFDAAVRDPKHPTQLLPAYDSGDHLHVNDAGNAAQANAISLRLFRNHQPEGRRPNHGRQP